MPHPKYGTDAYDLARYIKGLTQEAAKEEQADIDTHIKSEHLIGIGLKSMLQDKIAGKDKFPGWYGGPTT